MTNPLNNEIFQDVTKAREWLELLLWPDGRACGYCGVVNESSPLKNRDGFYQCNACRKQFTVMVGTVFERSHIPLNKWLMAAFLLCASKKGISAHQMHRMLGVTYKSAWFMMHRLREAMKPKNPPAIGGEGEVVEIDETFIGKRAGRAKRVGVHHKNAVLSLVERNGRARSFHIDSATMANVQPLVLTNVSRKSRIMTDESTIYSSEMGFKDHQKVNHSADEYVRGEASTNTVEGFFSIFKRGMTGVYQHCGEQHLQRYLSEFDFRYSNRAGLGVNDSKRAEIALHGIVGKRLTYRRINAS